MSFGPNQHLPGPPGDGHGPAGTGRGAGSTGTGNGARGPGDPAAAASLTDGEWHRLHPMTPLLRGGLVLIVILGYVVNNLRDTIINAFVPGQGGPDEGDPVRYVYEHGEVGWVLLGIVALLVVLIGLFYLSWRMHEFRVTGEIVEVRSGVLFRNHRKARLDRIQGINISRPLFPRLVGTAKLEIDQAGNDANVQLAYLGSKAADDLRSRILSLASGVREDEARERGGGSDRPVGLVQDRMDEFLSPELDPAAVHATRVVKIHPGRLIASMVLSGTSVVMVLAIVAIVLSIVVWEQWAVLVSAFPIVIGFGSYYVRKFSRSLQYTIAATRDGIRIGYGLVSTTNETLPPGRIHAVRVAQPLFWRPFGWWDVRINRATRAGNGSNANKEASSIVLPVGTAEDVRAVLEIILPELVGSAVAGSDASHDAKERGSAEAVGVVDDSLTTSGDAGGFVHSPRRGAWLRPLSWRRNGYRFVPGAVLLRLGFVWRSLVLVPLPRVQSVRVEQGPLDRSLRLAAAHVHTVSGPVTASLGALDAGDAMRLWVDAEAKAIEAAAADRSHRWREHGREARVDPGTSAPVAGSVAPEPADSSSADSSPVDSSSERRLRGADHAQSSSSRAVTGGDPSDHRGDPGTRDVPPGRGWGDVPRPDDGGSR